MKLGKEYYERKKSCNNQLHVSSPIQIVKSYEPKKYVIYDFGYISKIDLT